MVRYRRAWSESPEAMYFITYVTANREPVFQSRDDFLNQWKSWNTALKPYGGELFAWVFLPDHGHVILKQGSRSFSKSVAHFKRRVAFAFKATGMSIWQPRYWEHCIRDDNDLQKHTDYIHYNPVKHGVCKAAFDYKYSSFHRFVEQEIYPKDWATDEEIPATGEPVFKM